MESGKFKIGDLVVSKKHVNRIFKVTGSRMTSTSLNGLEDSEVSYVLSPMVGNLNIHEVENNIILAFRSPYAVNFYSHINRDGTLNFSESNILYNIMADTENLCKWYSLFPHYRKKVKYLIQANINIIHDILKCVSETSNMKLSVDTLLDIRNCMKYIRYNIHDRRSKVSKVINLCDTMIPSSVKK